LLKKKLKREKNKHRKEEIFRFSGFFFRLFFQASFLNCFQDFLRACQKAVKTRVIKARVRLLFVLLRW
jgi:hypothetical protein